MPSIILNLFIIFLYFFHLSPPVNSQLLPIINEFGGIDPTKIPIYIVHVEKPLGGCFSNLKNWYMSFLPNATLASGEPRMVYAYREVISGFAARLTPNEVEGMKTLDGFITAYPEKEHFASTTYTPTFLSLTGKPSNTPWDDTFMGAGQIIGVIDSGIDHNHPSFNDKDMPSPPSKWKGNCFWSGERTCNNKLLGAVAIHNGVHLEPYDESGHGTHVASTAAGNFVDDANVIEQAKGTASGMAPRAHLAIYKVLYKNSVGRFVATDGDIYAAIDRAILDDVDILQMSIGSSNIDLLNSSIAIGTFTTIAKGIIPCVAAGNSGPKASMLANDAPWLLTVGASTTDRRIMTSVLLGDGSELFGQSANQMGKFPSTQLSLAFPYDHFRTTTSKSCSNMAELNSLNLEGKIVMCYRINIGDETRGRNVMNSGGVAMILLNEMEQGETTNAFANVLPASHLGFTSTRNIINYYRNTKNPTASIKIHGTQFGISPTPAVASFSSRGPSLKNGGIIKPDVIAPGVNILGAWPQPVGPTSSKFKFSSGTSMATPHVSGVVALLKNKHPNWSPAKIKSAIMTTAYKYNREGKLITDEYDGSVANALVRGAGHINPERAINPGITYNLKDDDYVGYLCGLYKSDDKVKIFTKEDVRCAEKNVIASEQLNYPSFSVSIGKNKPEVRVTRKVTNVGDAESIYKYVEEMPEGILIEVSPRTLKFNHVEEEMSYEVKFKLASGSPIPEAGKVKDGQLRWESGEYSVTSPIIFMFV